MKHFDLLTILLIIFLMTPTLLHADDAPKKNHSLEEMTPAEFKEALKKSHAEIESRFGSSNSERSNDKYKQMAEREMLEDKRAYEDSIQSQLNSLEYKIRSLEFAGNQSHRSAASDAYKLRTIRSKILDQLIKIKSDDTDSWESRKQNVDSLLREVSYY